jgi:hypothetical protein
MGLHWAGVPRPDPLAEDDSARRERKTCGRGEKRVRAHEPPRPGPSTSKLLETRHRLTFGRDGRNSGRFRYEIRMNGAKIPRPGEKNRQSGGFG